jgi:hypothetical protein
MSATKNIIIYPHLKFSLNDGGMVVQYYLAQVLDSLGINVKIYNVHDNNAKNIIFNKFVYDINSIDFNNTIVIYRKEVVVPPPFVTFINPISCFHFLTYPTWSSFLAHGERLEE